MGFLTSFYRFNSGQVKAMFPAYLPVCRCFLNVDSCAQNPRTPSDSAPSISIPMLDSTVLHKTHNVTFVCTRFFDDRGPESDASPLCDSGYDGTLHYLRTQMTINTAYDFRAVIFIVNPTTSEPKTVKTVSTRT